MSTSKEESLSSKANGKETPCDRENGRVKQQQHGGPGGRCQQGGHKAEAAGGGRSELQRGVFIFHFPLEYALAQLGFVGVS